MVKAFRVSAPKNYPKECHALLSEINSLTEGGDPQFWISNTQKAGSAFFDEYTLFPGIVIPNYPETEWTKEEWYKISFGLSHLIRSLKRVPRLTVDKNGSTAIDLKIAEDINQTINKFFIEKYLLSKKIIPCDLDDDLTKQINDFIKNINEVTLPALIKFRALQIALKKIHGYRYAKSAWEIINKKYHNDIKDSIKTAKKLDQITNINEPISMTKASNIILDYLGRVNKKFEFTEYQISKGEKRTLDFYFYDRKMEKENKFEQDDFENKTVFSFTLPFKIPIKEGVYSSENYKILLEHKPSFNHLNPWKTSGNEKIEAQHDQYGLYENSKIQISLQGKFDSTDSPPNDIHYEIYKSYSETYYEVIKALNEWLNFYKTKNEKLTHLLPINLLHLNNCSIQVFSKGTKVRDILSRDNAFLKISFRKNRTGEKNVFENIKEVPFYKVLLSEAKRHLIETDPRRAMLDLYTAFESFIWKEISEKIDKNLLYETTKEKFLRMYEKNISKDFLSLVNGMEEVQKKNSCPVPIHRILTIYKQEELEPKINQINLKKIISLSELRNRAAHGENIDFSKLDNISEGIKALEKIISDFEIS